MWRIHVAFNLGRAVRDAGFLAVQRLRFRCAGDSRAVVCTGRMAVMCDDERGIQTPRPIFFLGDDAGRLLATKVSVERRENAVRPLVKSAKAHHRDTHERKLRLWLAIVTVLFV